MRMFFQEGKEKEELQSSSMFSERTSLLLPSDVDETSHSLSISENTDHSDFLYGGTVSTRTTTTTSSSSSSESTASSPSPNAPKDIDHNDTELGCSKQKNGVQLSSAASSSSSQKTIGMVGSISIAVNALAGPAILQLPFTYQAAGFVPTTIALFFVAWLSALCCMHMANIVSKVPTPSSQVNTDTYTDTDTDTDTDTNTNTTNTTNTTNLNFDQLVEFSDPFHSFWNRKVYYMTQILFYLCTLCMNIAAIVDTAQVVDSFLGHSIGTWGFAFDDWEMQQWIHQRPCSRHKVKKGLCIPFANTEMYGDVLLTLGYVITAAVFVPICLMDLKENTGWQIFGFCVLITTSIQFVFCFIHTKHGLNWNHIPAFGDDWEGVLGVILFNFGLVMAIPAWLSEKKSNIKVGTVVYTSTGISLLLYIIVGMFGAAAIPHVNSNMLQPMVSGAYGLPLRLSASWFAFFIIGLDIPLFSVLTRYNLVHSKLCSRRIANIFVVYMPWSLGWLFYQGSAISELLSWGGILFTAVIAFILPLCLAVKILYDEQRQNHSNGTTSSTTLTTTIADSTNDIERQPKQYQKQQYHQQGNKCSSSESTTIMVYGQWMTSLSPKWNYYATVGLLILAILSFIFAVVGQIITDQKV